MSQESQTTHDVETKELPVWTQFNKFWTPYKLSATVFFMLFLGADVSLFLFGKSATGNIFIALVLTLLSGVGVLQWKRQRDHEDSNEAQRSIALAMIIIHAVAAVIFLGGNFAKGGWETLASSVKIDGKLASQLMDYHVVLEKVFLWTIVFMLSANLISLFWFMEVDTEKKHKRTIAQMQRNDRTARLAAQEKQMGIANQEYKIYSDKLAQIQGLNEARARLLADNQGVMSSETLAQALSGIDDKILSLSGSIPANDVLPLNRPSANTANTPARVANSPANTPEEKRNFPEPPRRQAS